MMNVNNMMGVNGFSMMFFGWIIYIIILIVLVLAIIALVKYIEKK
ncbi:MAG TPA: hypothetical protein VJJ80_00925 [Patescibacteria group bacterium]|nr:hypothetical protein [Patescibacteria group bacterium]